MAWGSSSIRSSSPMSPLTAETMRRPRRVLSTGRPMPRDASARMLPLEIRRNPEIAP
jgi:hypothetical protein